MIETVEDQTGIIQHLKSENDHLNSENDHRKSENDQLKSENDHRKSENDQLKSENDLLNSDNDHLKSENEQLKLENADQSCNRCKGKIPGFFYRCIQCRRSLTKNQPSNRVIKLDSSTRLKVRIELNKAGQNSERHPFFYLLLDHDKVDKLDALQHLGNALRFLALVRTVLMGNITLTEVNQMTIDQGLGKITEAIEQKSVLLDRGRAVSTREHVYQLFNSFKTLWDRFSNIRNLKRRTFLDITYSERFDIIMDKNQRIGLILAGYKSSYHLYESNYYYIFNFFVSYLPFFVSHCA